MKRKNKIKDLVREEFYKGEGDIQTLEQGVAFLDRQLKKNSTISITDRQDAAQEVARNLLKRNDWPIRRPLLLLALKNQNITQIRKNQRASRWQTNPDDGFSLEQIHYQPAALADVLANARDNVVLIKRYAHFLDRRLTPTLRLAFRLSLARMGIISGFLLGDLEKVSLSEASKDALCKARSRLRRELPKRKDAFLRHEGLAEDSHAVGLLTCFNQWLASRTLFAS